MENSSIAVWVSGAIGLLLAVVLGIREVFKQRHDRALEKQKTDAVQGTKQFDATSDFAQRMLGRISKLEERELEDRREHMLREDTLRSRLDAVEREAEGCQRQYAVLSEQHRALLGEVGELSTENDALRNELRILRGHNLALNQELQLIYKQLGLKRSSPSLPAIGSTVVHHDKRPTLQMPAVVEEVSIAVSRKRGE